MVCKEEEMEYDVLVQRLALLDKINHIKASLKEINLFINNGVKLTLTAFCGIWSSRYILLHQPRKRITEDFNEMALQN